MIPAGNILALLSLLWVNVSAFGQSFPFAFWSNSGVSITGCTSNVLDGTAHVCTLSVVGTNNITVVGTGSVQELIVGGGAGAGQASPGSFTGGGGGSGDVVPITETLSAGTYAVTVGDKGASGVADANGGDSTFNGHTALGGGKGYSAATGATCSTGGSGGGTGNGGTVCVGTGTNVHSGGTGTNGAGGGGGPSSAGSDGSGNAGGNGGGPFMSSITGTSLPYGGGGGGGSIGAQVTGIGGGCGGDGGNGHSAANPPTDATCYGGGAGGGRPVSGTGSNAFQGAVILRY